ncbi:hypothetical protein ACLB2K_063013 [Fragaria x ananassa]
MASCSLGTSYPKITNLNLCRTRVGISQSYGVRTWTLQRPQLYSAATSSDDGSKESDSGSANPRIPDFDEIQSLLTTRCDTTSVAEVQLKLGGFRLHVVRELTENVSTPPPSIPTSVSVSTPAEVPESNGSVPAQSLAITRAEPSSRDIQTLLDKAADEGLVLIQSPRVGLFRRSRTIKGKRAPPSCKEKQIVKEGQVICYIEQLGGELPIESDVAGEVINILREDGEPVGYGDALVAVLPSFPGIKKLQ